VHKEPAVIVNSITAIVAAIVAALVAFGLDLTEEQQGAILLLVAALAPVIAGFISRQFVYAPATVEALEGGRVTTAVIPVPPQDPA
jgi:hypothetical protein